MVAARDGLQRQGRLKAGATLIPSTDDEVRRRRAWPSPVLAAIATFLKKFLNRLSHMGNMTLVRCVGPAPSSGPCPRSEKWREMGSYPTHCQRTGLQSNVGPEYHHIDYISRISQRRAIGARGGIGQEDEGQAIPSVG